MAFECDLPVVILGTILLALFPILTTSFIYTRAVEVLFAEDWTWEQETKGAFQSAVGP